jgi:hypothetical protein
MALMEQTMVNHGVNRRDFILRPAPQCTVTTVDTAPTDTVTATGFAVVDTEVWAFIGRDVYSWNYSTAQWNKGTVPNAATRIYRNGVAAPVGYVVAPSWNPADNTADRYIYKRDADANWTRIGAGTGASVKYFAPGRTITGAAIVWGGHIDGNVNEIRSSTDISGLGNWSSAIVVGSSAAPITALVDYDGQLIICKTDGVWSYRVESGPLTSLDVATTVVHLDNLTPDFQFSSHPDHFRAAHAWNGRVILPLGNSGMLELRGNVLRDISLCISLPEQEHLHGVVTAVASSANTLYILVRDTENGVYHVLAGHLDEQEEYQWESLADIAYSGTPTNAQYHTSMLVESVTSGATLHHRLLVGITDTGGDYPYVIPLSDFDTAWAYTTGTARATTMVFDAGFPHFPKTFAEGAFEFDHLQAGLREIRVEYRVERDAEWSLLGTLPEAGASFPYTFPLTFPASAATAQTLAFPAGTSGLTLELRFTFTQDASTTPCELLRFRITYSLRNTPIETIPLAVYIADGQRLLNGSTESRMTGLLALLRAWDAQGAEVRVVDAEGVSRDMVFLPGTLKLTQVRHEAGRRPEWVAQALLAEV